jgi:hypothetical protein
VITGGDQGPIVVTANAEHPAQVIRILHARSPQPLLKPHAGGRYHAGDEENHVESRSAHPQPWNGV